MGSIQNLTGSAYSIPQSSQAQSRLSPAAGSNFVGNRSITPPSFNQPPPNLAGASSGRQQNIMNLMQQAVAATQANASGVIGGGGGGGSQQQPIGASSTASMQQHLQHLHQQQQQQAAAMAATTGRNPLFGRENRQKLGDSLLSPNTFDPSEFPSLGQNSAPASALSARPNYGA
jgi:hypothetical protein